MKYTLQGVSALALVAALAMTGCNRTEDVNTTGAVDSNPTLPDDTAQSPATLPSDTTAEAESMGDRAVGALDDATVTAKVKAALLATDGISSSDISVETEQGRVILTGRVPDQMQAERAEDVAEGVEGVLAVENRIEVGAG